MIARYGAENIGEWGLRENVEKFGSLLIKAWWRIGQGKGRVGSAFKENLRILMGRGNNTLF